MLSEWCKSICWTEIFNLGLVCYYLSSAALETSTAIAFENASSCFYKKMTPFYFMISSVLCSAQYMRNSTLLNGEGANQLLVILLKANKMFWWFINFLII